MPTITGPSISDAVALVPEAALAVGIDGTILAANGLALAMFASGIDGLVGTPVNERLPLAQTVVELLAANDTGQRRALSLAARRLNHVPFPVEASIGRVDLDSGVAAICVLRELKDAALLSAAECYFDVAFDRAPIGMALFNTDGEYVRVNDALCGLLGRTADELIGARDQELTHPDDRAADVGVAWDILNGLKSTHQTEKRFVRPDGSVVWTLASLTFLRDDDGRPLSWLGQFQDITGRRDAEEALRRSEERHRLVVRNLAGAAVVLYDRDLRCVLVEGDHVGRAGLDRAATIGRTMRENAPEVVDILEPLARKALQGEESEVETRSPRTGGALTVQVRPHRNADGEIVGALLRVRDVSEQRAAERATRDAERHFEVIFDRAPIGMALIALDGRFLRVNRACTEMCGYSPDELAAMEPFLLVHPEDRVAVRRAFAGFADQGAHNVALEHRTIDPSGATMWIRTEATLIRDADDRPLHVLAQTRDITERRRHEAELQHLANHDALTGLLNRRGFRDSLDQHVARVRRYGPAGGLLLVDLDGFKAVNDSFGHQAGDELVVACARALSSRLRASDVIGRLGGDEFAILLPRGGGAELRAVAQAVVEVVRHAGSCTLPDGSRITSSVGVAPIDGSVLSAEELLERADQAMYEAKAAGRDRYAVHRGDG